MIYVYISLFVLLLLGFWLLNLFGLPGNWLILLTTLLWVGFGPQSDPYHIGWSHLLILLALAVVGELVEFGASVAGTSKLGGSKTGATCSLIGSILGGICGAIFTIPIPVVGMIIGSVLFACIGAMVGAIIGEKMVGQPTKSSLKIGGAAFAGRLLGTVGKVTLGSAMVVLAIIGVCI